MPLKQFMSVYEKEILKPQPAPVPGAFSDRPDISVFLPVLNEEPNLRPLHGKLDRALAHLGRSAEIIYVDDGSTDGSLNVLREIAARDSRAGAVPAPDVRDPPCGSAGAASSAAGHTVPAALMKVGGEGGGAPRGAL